MHKLGSSPIGCEDLSIPGGITNGISVQGRPLSLMKGLCNLGKAMAKQDQISITLNLSVTHVCIYIYVEYYGLYKGILCVELCICIYNFTNCCSLMSGRYVACATDSSKEQQTLHDPTICQAYIILYDLISYNIYIIIYIQYIQSPFKTGKCS